MKAKAEKKTEKFPKFDTSTLIFELLFKKELNEIYLDIVVP